MAANLDDAFAGLGQFLKDRCGDAVVYYVANPGNWGDALIRQGTLLFFRDIGLRFNEIKDQQELATLSPSINTLIYGGGGAWCKLWNHGEVWATSFKQRFHVIVLPSTYEMPYAIPNTTLFCRDRYESQANVPAATFCHDMAFYLKHAVSPSPGGSGEGWFLRTDAESGRSRPIPPNNDDVSPKGNQLSDIAPLLATVAKFESVHTDRLHVAITGCLLGKKVHLYPNSYFKNRAVYLSSMKDYFDNVEFMGNL
jgi:exopolysaccharide biosynthesis predicted pyruvyltransferase EpsI